MFFEKLKNQDFLVDEPFQKSVSFTIFSFTFKQFQPKIFEYVRKFGIFSKLFFSKLYFSQKMDADAYFSFFILGGKNTRSSPKPSKDHKNRK